SNSNPTSNTYGFYQYKTDYCAYKNNADFKIREVYAAIETQIPIKPFYCYDRDEVGNCLRKDPNPCMTLDGRQNMPGRKFPDKWYTRDEWGWNDGNIQQNAFNYFKGFAASFCPADLNKDCVVDVLEVGNEPWGQNTPGRNGYHAILRGAVQAFKEVYGEDKSKWRMKLSAAALDARFACNNAPNQYVHEMIPNDTDVKDYIDYLNVHNYPFIKTPCGVEVDNLKLEYIPESPNGGFMALKNMDEWRRGNGMEHARINITEFGWNSDKEECNFGVGEINQAAYIVRANLLGARFGTHKIFNYPLIDLPKVYNVKKERLESVETPLYCTTGLIARDGKKKLSYHATETMVKKLAGKHFIKAVDENYTEEEQIFSFLVGSYNAQTDKSTPTHLVAWRSSDLGTSNNNSRDYPKMDSELGRGLTTITLPSSNMTIDEQADYFYLGWDGGRPKKIGNAVVNQNGVAGNQVKVDLSGLPIVIPIKDGGCRYDKDGQLDNCANDATIPSGSGDGGTLVSCDEINISFGGNWINWTGKSGINYPKVELIKVTGGQYKIIKTCPSNCGDNGRFSGLEAGDYLLKVFAPNWELACNLDYGKKIQLTGNSDSNNPCAVLGGDADNDGICASTDCDDTNPNYPQPIGTPCDDGYANTQNDKIQADGCTCSGESSDNNSNLANFACSGVTVRYGNGQITFEGQTNKSYHFKYQLKKAPYTQENCYNCGNKTYNGVADGPYEITVNYQSCRVIELKSDEGGKDCEDNDGDGVCNEQDCAPWDSSLPKQVGATCNDYDPNTENDKIQADGCTCKGTPIGNNGLTTKTCEEITIRYGVGTIEMIGSSDKSYKFSINDMNNGWKEVFSCWSNCGSSKKVTGLRASKYKVKIYGGQNTCDLEITLPNPASSRSLPNNLIELGTSIQAQTIHLDWVASRLGDTESFVVEKSMDGINFKSIEIINPYTTHTEDNGPDYGVNYYRIKQQFLSGESRYSPVQTESYYLDKSSISIYPNPTTSVVNVSMGQFSDLEGELIIFNRSGNEMAIKKLNQTGKTVSFDTSNFTSGIYFLVIQPKRGKAFTRQFMVANE
ncbi:MAG: T9SS type A sorting domain-containing protein, partial [Bacteroidota bacterium]